MANVIDDVRTDIPGEVYPEGDLPQIGGSRQTLQPGIDVFRLPVDLARCWHAITVTREGVRYQHLQLKFDKDSPLVVEGGPNHGAPMLASFSSVPRPRGRRDDPTTPVISDLALVLEIGFGDRSRPLAKGGSAALVAIEQAITRFAGQTLRLEHGLGGQCRPDKVRYVFQDETSLASVIDPTGQKGCGARYYTKAYKAPVVKPGEPLYDDVIQCKTCGAAVRGFETVDRILPPR